MEKFSREKKEPEECSKNVAKCEHTCIVTFITEVHNLLAAFGG